MTCHATRVSVNVNNSRPANPNLQIHRQEGPASKTSRGWVPKRLFLPRVPACVRRKDIARTLDLPSPTSSERQLAQRSNAIESRRISSPHLTTICPGLPAAKRQQQRAKSHTRGDDVREGK